MLLLKCNECKWYFENDVNGERIGAAYKPSETDIVRELDQPCPVCPAPINDDEAKDEVDSQTPLKLLTS